MTLKLIVITTLVSGLIFIADLAFPLGVASGMMYVVPVLIGGWFPKKRFIFAAALLGSTLTVIGALLSEPGGELWIVIVNRGLALSALWLTAVLLSIRLTERNNSNNQIETLTELRDAELALNQSENQYRRLFEDSGVGMVCNDFAGHFIRVNHAFCNMLGYSEAELLTKTVAEITHVEDKQSTAESRQRAIDEGRTLDTVEKRFIRKDSTVIWGLLNRSLVRDRDNKPAYFESQIQDISERKNLEEERLSHHERLHQANLIAGLGFFDRDLSDETLYWSDQMFQIFGITGERPKLSNELFLNFVHPGDLEKVKLAIQKTLAETGAQETEFKIRRADGTFVDVLTIRKAFRDKSGRPLRIIGTMRDISRQKSIEQELINGRDQLEARVKVRTNELNQEVERRKVIGVGLLEANLVAERANEAKSDFLANMSHELRTPLNAIIGFSESLIHDIYGALANKKQREIVAHIQTSSLHLQELINDVLDISSIESGKLELQYEMIDLASLIASAIELVEQSAKVKFIQLENKVKGEVISLYIDELRIRQVLVNLLSNAIKFTPDHGNVNVDYELSLFGGIKILVTDTGIGMDEAGIETAMMRFGQNINDETSVIDGTGLGLPLSKSLMEALGGSLVVTSELGVGTTVMLELPEQSFADKHSSK